MNHKTLMASLFMLASSSAFTATSNDNLLTSPIVKKHTEQQVKLAAIHAKEQFSEQVEFQHQIVWQMAKVKTKDDLEQLLLSDSPLDLLSPAAKERFVDSIVFREKGLGGFYSDDIVAELTPSQAYRILSLFGAQHVLPKLRGMRIESKVDAMLAAPGPVSIYKDNFYGYKCESPGTCKKTSSNYICTSNC